MTNVSISKIADYDFHWSGSVDGMSTEGALVFYDGDETGSVYVAFFDENDQAVAGFELPASGLDYVGIDVLGLAASPNCVCWRPQGASCTNAECNDSDTCGTGGVCMWRWTRTASIQQLCCP